jgi:2-polyprenyl-6-methoxyphenol hydroxylase-like FAD-dependent oxidoreductase
MVSRDGQESAIPVLIVGAGPVGLSLALALARHGVRTVLVEKNDSTSEHSKAPGIHLRTREAFRGWGIEENLAAAGTVVSCLDLRSVTWKRSLFTLDLTQLADEADRPGILILEQGRTEALLLDAVRTTGMCDVRFGAEAVDLVSDAGGARLTIREDGVHHELAADFLVGCDGASSFVRGAMGLPFEGMTYALQPMLADIRLDDRRDALAWPRLWNGPHTLTTALRLAPGLWRIIGLERGSPDRGDDVDDDEVRQRVEHVLGPGAFEIVWASRFRIHLRSSPRFRVDRVILAGDAAHVHSPIGGLGMNAGIQDAHNLGWKLARALKGGDTERLLESYEVERRAIVVGQVSRYADLLTRLFLEAPPVVRDSGLLLFRLALAVPPIHRLVIRRMTMIDLGYPGSPILSAVERSAGKRIPDSLLQSPEGADVRLHELLGDTATILDVAETRAFASDLPIGRAIRIGPGAYRDPGGALRGLLGGRDGWVLVRPDGHVAWARTERDGMEAAVRFALGDRAEPPGASTHGRPVVAGAGT